jgi:Flp pilus assembly protein TadG
MKKQSERGAILVHVAIGLLAVIAFSAFTVDYGQLWVSRRQAQNAADAGALAGAVSRIMEDPSNPPSSTTSGVVWESAVNAAAANVIWGVSPPSNTISLSYTCPDGVSTTCVAVDVFRDGTNNSNPLSTFFLNLVNIDTQGVRAHAVAEVRGANVAPCIRPFFVIDKYDDLNGNGIYDAGDGYTAPGWKVPDDIGVDVDFHENTSPSGYGQLDVGKGADDRRDAIKHCVGDATEFAIGQTVPTQPGGEFGPNTQGIDAVFGWDEEATFNAETGQVEDTCAPNCTCGGDPLCPYGGRISPRVFIVPICRPDTDTDCSQGGPNNGSITITEFLAFFIKDPPYTGNGKTLTIHATLMGSAGLFDPNFPAPPGPSSFLKVPVLIR